ncbi:MAG: sialate O-acetylesterase [Luteolibacter sp.]
MTSRISAIVAILALASTANAQDPVQVVLLAGQSNMDGNVPAAALPQEFRKPPVNVSLIDKGKPVRIADGKFFGPEVAFAATVAAARPADDFLLVKRAMGGTSLAGWAPQWDESRLASKYDTAAGPLYRKLLEDYAAAIKGRPARLTGVLWMQGESDTRYPALGSNYFENFKTLIAAFRRDLKAPELPFFFGRVNMPADVTEEDKKTIKFPYIQQVRAAQERAAREIPGVFLIETDDLGKQADRIHYDAAGQIALGRRFAEAWLKTMLLEPQPPQAQVLSVAGRPAFLIPAEAAVPGDPKPWVWYAPTLPRLPGAEERWMFEKLRAAGISIAGIDVGESYGSPTGRESFSKFHAEMTEKRGYSHKPVMLGRSRGGLMNLSWAAENPEKVAAFAGIYPVCNLASYPGVAKAAPAYQMTPENLQNGLVAHNPIDRLASLAKAGVPFFAIHGDSDKVVPLEDHSALLKSRYEALGGSMRLIAPPGQGHNHWQGFFQCQELLDFVISHAKP